MAVDKLSARLVAFEPNGAQIPVALLDSVSWDASFARNDNGALSIHYPNIADAIGLLTTPVEIAVQVHNGVQWSEPRNARFISSEDQTDSSSDLVVPTITMRSYGVLLDRATVLRAAVNNGKPYTTEGKRNFLSATPGQILLSVLQESRTRYPQMLAGLITDFTTSTDSLGNAWGALTSVAYEPDTSLLTVLADLANYGLIDWWLEGRKLRVVNIGAADTTRATRLNLTDVAESPVRGSWEGVATHVRVDGGNGHTWEQAVPGADSPWGTRVIVIANDSVTTSGTANTLINQQLDLARSKRFEYSRTIQAFDSLPLVDYLLGDFVQARNLSGEWESMRVQELGISYDSTDAGLTASITLNDRFVDAEVRNAAKMKGITHGVTQLAGDGSVPSRSDRAVPAAPGGLTASSSGYWSGATPLSSVDLNWAPVAVDTDGLALNGVDHYEWQVAGRTGSVGAASAGVNGLTPSRIIDIRVRAFSQTGIAGVWSNTLQITTAMPNTKLDPPTVPTFRTENGGVQVIWDGMLKAATGSAHTPPAYFGKLYTETASAATGPWTRLASDAGRVVTGLSLGTVMYARFVAVDVAGLESDPGPVGSVTVKSQAQEAANAASAAQTTANGANARLSVDYGSAKPTTRTNGTALVQGDELITWKSGNAIQVEVWNGTAWASSYLLSGGLFVLSSAGTVTIANGVVDTPSLKATAIDGMTITGAIIRTAEPVAGVASAQLSDFDDGHGLKITGVDGALGEFLTSPTQGTRLAFTDASAVQRFSVDSNGLMTMRGASTGIVMQNESGDVSVRLDAIYADTGKIYGLHFFKGSTEVITIGKNQNANANAIINLKNTNGNDAVFIHGGDGATFYPQIGVNGRLGDNLFYFSGSSSFDIAHMVYSSGAADGLNLKDNGNGRIRIWGLSSASGSVGNLKVHASSSGTPFLVLESSARRFKREITPTTLDWRKLLELEPIEYSSQSDLDEWTKDHPDATDEEQAAYAASLPRMTGLIAEDVEAAGLTGFTTHDLDGVINGLDYGRMVSLFVNAIKDHDARIAALEGSTSGD